jgi:hypothetical protein
MRCQKRVFCAAGRVPRNELGMCVVPNVAKWTLEDHAIFFYGRRDVRSLNMTSRRVLFRIRSIPAHPARVASVPW